MFKPREPITHVVKAWPDFFQSVQHGEKTAELRKNDRDYRKGDTLLLQEYDPAKKIFTGHECRVPITDMLENFAGLEPGYCVLSIKVPNDASRFNADQAGKEG